MEIKNKFIPDPKIKLMDQVRQVLRYHHYSSYQYKDYEEDRGFHMPAIPSALQSKFEEVFS